MNRKSEIEDGSLKLAKASPPPRSPASSIHQVRSRKRGFTLIEVLATMLLIAIVLPTVMRGVAAASGTASLSRHRTEAAGLAQAKLAQLMASGEWQAGILSGDFGADYPDYRWRATVTAWPLDQTTAGLQLVDCSVLWTGRGGREDSVTVSTLTYVRTTASSASVP